MDIVVLNAFRRVQESELASISDLNIIKKFANEVDGQMSNITAKYTEDIISELEYDNLWKSLVEKYDCDSTTLSHFYYIITEAEENLKNKYPKRMIYNIDNQSDILAVAMLYTSFKTTGRYNVFRGLTPFYKGSSNCFYVYRNTNRYNCYSTGWIGSSLNLLSEKTSLSVCSIIETLAEIFEIELFGENKQIDPAIYNSVRQILNGNEYIDLIEKSNQKLLKNK